MELRWPQQQPKSLTILLLLLHLNDSQRVIIQLSSFFVRVGRPGTRDDRKAEPETTRIWTWTLQTGFPRSSSYSSLGPTPPGWPSSPTKRWGQLFLGHVDRSEARAGGCRTSSQGIREFGSRWLRRLRLFAMGGARIKIRGGRTTLKGSPEEIPSGFHPVTKPKGIQQSY